MGLFRRGHSGTRTVLVSVGVPVVGKLSTAIVVHGGSGRLPVVVRATCTFATSHRGTLRYKTSRILMGPVALSTLHAYLDHCLPGLI